LLPSSDARGFTTETLSSGSRNQIVLVLVVVLVLEAWDRLLV
jgi:hypothetical protein